MTHKQFRQLCERAEHEPADPGRPTQLRALVDVIEEMLKRRESISRLFSIPVPGQLPPDRSGSGESANPFCSPPRS
jgi:hypothetical protein